MALANYINESTTLADAVPLTKEEEEKLKVLWRKKFEELGCLVDPYSGPTIDALVRRRVQPHENHGPRSIELFLQTYGPGGTTPPPKTEPGGILQSSFPGDPSSRNKSHRERNG